MAFRELDYQARALAALDAWLERLGEEKAKADKVAEVRAANPELDIPLPDFPAKAWERLAADKGVPGGRTFSPRLSGDDWPVPNATLKVPTGGGKTYLACAALSRIFGRYVSANTGMVLWIVPNEAIYSQTLKALRDRDHAYRQTLDRAAANRVKVLEKDDPLHKTDLDTHLCVMVLMLQSSNRENQESLRLFRDRGDVHGFVPADGEQAAHKALKDAIPNLSIYDLGDGGPPWPMVKASMGNAMRIVRPVVIMDEGQKAVSDLAHSTLYGFNPRLVLELSATPKDVPPRPARNGQPAREGRTANILVEITGRELEREGMIKMPMNVSPLPGGEWQATLAKAWERLEQLERTSREYEGDGGRYIRPILLVQVERTGKEQAEAGFIHADNARDWLKAVAGLEDDEIAYKTAEQNDLDKPENRDLLSPKCRVRAIITKAALAEGWDCPFAYVLCALAANSNEGALTQLVGRILRQPHAIKTNVDALDECYVFAHRADTQATVTAIREGLQGDGLGDLAVDVNLSDSGGASSDAPIARKVQRRDAFRTTAIALPQVLTVEAEGVARPFDAETDLFPLIDWAKLDLAPLADKLPKERLGDDHHLIRLSAGDAGVEVADGPLQAASAIAAFDGAYAVRILADLVPNAFTAWALVDDLLNKLRANGWADADFARLASFLIDELRKELDRERERQAAELFASGLDAGTIQFALRGDDHDWHAPFELPTGQPESAAPLLSASHGPLERSLFLPIYRADLNEEEQGVAVYLDRESAVRWWHRNGTGRGSYGLRGWRRGNIYPDFLLAATRDEADRERIVVLETKGVHLAGNEDTEYKRALLEKLTDKFSVMPHTADGLPLTVEPFDFTAALVVFSNVQAELPAMIHAGK
ncbi:DEAD/DEAH box helicase family protein [Qipengyuania gaetbuli]|uniref:DEAD/DEAH box helicase family protein n=1 Tax=Qipengyuania gaetbuli TaxID=266952 RepID=UPI001CD1F3BC|nr:DEAD/DEAH box helicase family protein [Qipengyuania gaetbuli]MCA0910998.1 DEAD/DEAH box helicase family protein [Qipengyuania gaetbuli]